MEEQVGMKSGVQKKEEKAKRKNEAKLSGELFFAVERQGNRSFE